MKHGYSGRLRGLRSRNNVVLDNILKELDGIDIKLEYDKIKEKRSTLSARLRSYIVYAVEQGEKNDKT